MHRFPSRVQLARSDIPDISRADTVKASSVELDVDAIETVKTKSVKLEADAVDTVKAKSVELGADAVETIKMSATRGFRRPDVMDIVLFMLTLLSMGLWLISLQHVSVTNMNDLGLVSVLSPKIIVALVILVVSFVVTLQRPDMRVGLLALQIFCIILILNGTQNLIEEMPRFAVVYRHAGYTEYIMRTGTVDPSLDAYFSWPIFFTLSAFVTKVAGYSTILSYAGWAPVFYSVIYLGPTYMIFATATSDKRLIWLALLIFSLTNWVGQNYFSPQGLNLFLYLVVIAMVLKWFKMPATYGQAWQPAGPDATFRQKFMAWLKAPDPASETLQPWQQRGMLCCLILIFGLIVSTHQLTPFFLIVDVGALVVFRRSRPFWLPILMTAMTLVWLFVMASTFLAGHSSMVFGGFGDIFSNLFSSTTGRAAVGDAQHQVVGRLRLVMTGLIWLLAFLGGIRRLREGHRDLTYILLATVGFVLIATQDYGGEMFLRIYLFTLPFMSFFAAALFYGKPLIQISPSRAIHIRPSWMTGTLIVANLILLVGFFFTCYGNEREDYMTYAEWNGVQRLYQIAPAHALLIEATSGAPWQFENYEKYSCVTLTDTDTLTTALLASNVSPIVNFIETTNPSSAYIIFTRSEQAQLTAYVGGAPNTMSNMEAAMLKSGEFKLVYSNTDAQILQFSAKKQGGTS